MKNLLPIAIFVVILIAIDLYAFKSLKLVVTGWVNPNWKWIISAIYWVTSVAAYVAIVYSIITFRAAQQQMDYYFFFMGFGILLMLFIPKLVVILFHGADDIIHLFRKIASMFIRNTNPAEAAGSGITRWQFLSRTGWLLAALPFLGILYGMARGRYEFRVISKSLKFDNLPASADGLRIVHISDIHIGSFFNNYEAVQRGIDKVNELKPDLILFTGDLVNNFADELLGWEDTLSKLSAKYGIYSVFGNHDYGDYVKWESAEQRAENLEKLKTMHKKMGFNLLLNERVEFKTDAGESFDIIGIENWGLGGFSQYGDLKKAMNGSDDRRFQVLLSHDPSHWDAEVVRKTKIDLALAGHTHGMQFGVEIPGIIKWSPVKYRYPRWGGLYSEGKQHLYVNRGFGYIGFPGRIGMPPEITLLELHKG